MSLSTIPPSPPSSFGCRAKYSNEICAQMRVGLVHHDARAMRCCALQNSVHIAVPPTAPVAGVIGGAPVQVPGDGRPVGTPPVLQQQDLEMMREEEKGGKQRSRHERESWRFWCPPPPTWPSGRHTRSISCSAWSGSSTEHRPNVSTTVSNEASAKGRASAPACKTTVSLSCSPGCDGSWSLRL